MAGGGSGTPISVPEGEIRTVVDRESAGDDRPAVDTGNT